MLSPLTSLVCLQHLLTSTLASAPAHAHQHAPLPPTRLTLLPEPASYSFGNGSTPVCLSSRFSIRLPLPHHSGPATWEHTDLARAACRTEAHLRENRHAFLSVRRGDEFRAGRRRGDGDGYGELGCKELHGVQLVLVPARIVATEEEAVYTRSIIDGATAPVERRAALEAYNLSLPIDGQGSITAASPLGLLRGLTTLEQLFYHLPSNHRHGRVKRSWSWAALASPNDLARYALQTLGMSKHSGTQYAPFAPYDIRDEPVFGWRALHLDTSRHYFSLASLYKVLDTMALVKLNVFHWHITDSQSWPLDLDAFPELAQAGAYPWQTYSQAQVSALIEYAGERGIDVLLEVDMPGHTASIAHSHPEHIACFERPWEHYGPGQPPAGQLRYASDATVAWTTGLVRALVGVVRSAYVGVGGDELGERCMREDPETQRDLAKNGWTLDDALDHFVNRTHGPILQAHKTPVVWQEMAVNHDLASLSRSTIVHIWKHSEDSETRRILDKGFRIVQAPEDYFYLDCGQGAWIDAPHGGESWCGGTKTWARILSFDPWANTNATTRKQVVGGQTALWAEQTDEGNVEQMLWPRAAALGELFWAGAGGEEGKAGKNEENGKDGEEEREVSGRTGKEVQGERALQRRRRRDPSKGSFPRDAREAMGAMHDTRYRMVDRGVRAAPIQPHWCALRPGAC